MVQIIPRWEWRMFAKQVAPRIDLGSYNRTRHVESSEIYLVSSGSSGSRANPKIRDGKMDIKTLQSVNEDGLEQWKPEMKASFPLSTDQLAMVYGALALAAPTLDGDSIDLEAFLSLIDEDGHAMAVHVDKVRDQYDVDGCTVEMSSVTFDGDGYKTIAVEDASPVKVRDTVEKLGLLGVANVNYVKFIKQLKGLG